MAADFSVVAIIAAYNEADIIEHVVSDLIDQGIHVYFMDDGSTDRTMAAVEQYLGRGVLGIEPRPDRGRDGAPPTFEWERILRRKTQLATELDASWFIHHDADEFRESPWAHLSLKDAIRQVDALGFNAIDFASLDFWPVHNTFHAGDDVRDVFTRYAERAPYDRLQIRCWKKTMDLDLASSGGHDARFPNRKIFPVRFILRHYPIRGQAHGERKVFHERQNRFLERERVLGWHVQYDELREGASFIRDAATLTPYDPDALRVALTLRHRGVEALEASLGDSQAVAEMRRLEGDQLRDDLSRTRAELDAVNAAAITFHNDLHHRMRELGETRAALGHQDAELAARRDEAAGLRVELTTRTAELEARSAALDALNTELVARSAELAARRAELGASLADLGHRNAELAARRDEAAGLQTALDQRTTEIARWRATHEEQVAEIERWRAAHEEQVAEIARGRVAAAEGARQLDEVHRSLSWRLTSPLRAIFRIFKER